MPPTDADTVSERLQQLRDRAWMQMPHQALAKARGVPSMLSRDEQKLYFWLGRNYATGAGDVVDLGSFVGGSSARLAAGLEAGGAKARVHAFDKFAADEKTKENVLYKGGIAPFDGSDILPLAQRLLAPWKDRIVFHQGEITQQSWHGPIEILTLDASKIAALMDTMAAMFFPSLLPGRSVIVQQDFLHFSQPWIAAQMELLADYFTPLAYCPRDSIVYLCTRQIDAEAIEIARTASLSDDELLTCIRRANTRLAQYDLTARFDRMREALRLNPSKRIAWQFRAPPRQSMPLKSGNRF